MYCINESQNSNNENRNIVVEAITRSIARMVEEFDSLCACCINYRHTDVVTPKAALRPVTPPSLFELQSEESGETGSSAEVTSQTVTFLDANEGDVVPDEVSQNTVAMVDNTADLALGSFLSRPTLIYTKNWTTSEVIGVVDAFKPWYLFLNNAVIKRKLENYAFIRGNLHIKTIVNGTPFQYGSIRMCYKPLLGFISDPIRAASFSAQTSMVTYSQVPGYYIYPEANAGGTMTLPFFLHKNWLDLTSAAEVQNMGEVVHAIYAPLRVAVSGGTTSVTMRTYAWMSDVQLMGSTSKLTLQGDEYGQGIVSRPASAIAAIASKLTQVPIIGPFAKATTIGASAVSSIASLFGYTNVPVIEDVRAVQPMNAPMLATAHIGTPIQKLAYDPKQELSIDPAPHGIGSKDELALSYIKEKESFYGTANWTTAQADGTALLFTRVNPMIFGKIDVVNQASALVGHRVYHTPLSYTSQLFTHWRGDIKIRMKVVCTKFHKGRLKISYDPVGDISASDPPENTVYTEIFDIGEHTDVTFTIPYHQNLGWLQIRKQLSDNWTAGTALAPRAGFDNGLLSVRVLNALSAPATGTVSILFYISGGENFEFANPSGFVGNDAGGFEDPSFFALQSEDTTSIQTYHVKMGKDTVTTPDRYALNFGECIGSLRNVIHRFSNFETTPGIQVGSNLYAVARKVLKRMPYTPGFDPAYTSTLANRITVASGTAPYVWTTMHPLPYITGMYLGYRGSVNYCITPSTDGISSVDDCRVARCTEPIATAANRYIENAGTQGYAANSSNKARFLNVSRNFIDGTGGMAITSTQTNGSIVFNFPDYNNYNFSLVDPTKYVLGTSVDGTDIQNVLFQHILKRTSDTQTDIGLSCSYQIQAAAGPDFTCLFWYCCPTLDYASSLPSAP